MNSALVGIKIIDLSRKGRAFVPAMAGATPRTKPQMRFSTCREHSAAVEGWCIPSRPNGKCTLASR